MKARWLPILLALPLNAFAFTIQGDVSYFRPTSSVLRDIYGDGWVDYKVEIAQRLDHDQWLLKRLNIFADVSYLSNWGHSIGGGNRTHIQILPISLGLKWIEPINHKVNFYVGAAPRYFFVRTHDFLDVVREKIHKSGMGGVVMTGFNFFFNKNIYLDIFASYSFKEFSRPHTPHLVKGHSLEVGGLDAGGGLGWRF